MDARRGGFSLIELLMAVSIVGILAGLAIPNLTSMTYRARATEVAGDLEVVRVATVSYNGDSHRWPADAALGAVPPELTAYLPEGYTFQGNGYEIKFENLSFPGGLPGDPTTTQLIGATVVVERDELSNAIVELLGGSLVVSAGKTHTIVIDRS
jgi:prepilin-type N-terminal cleavage/methylation domain-containing protein